MISIQITKLSILLIAIIEEFHNKGIRIRCIYESENFIFHIFMLCNRWNLNFWNVLRIDLYMSFECNKDI